MKKLPLFVLLLAVSILYVQQAVAQKEADRIRKVLVELDEYEHNILYPLASRQLSIHLDDGVKANYPKFGTAVKKIPGLEASNE